MGATVEDERKGLRRSREEVVLTFLWLCLRRGGIRECGSVKGGSEERVD